jgi:hypothetical protein
MGGGNVPSYTSQVQTKEVPPEFQPAYYRMFESALGAGQQAAQSPFGAGGINQNPSIYGGNLFGGNPFSQQGFGYGQQQSPYGQQQSYGQQQNPYQTSDPNQQPRPYDPGVVGNPQPGNQQVAPPAQQPQQQPQAPQSLQSQQLQQPWSTFGPSLTSASQQPQAAQQAPQAPQQQSGVPLQPGQYPAATPVPPMPTIPTDPISGQPLVTIDPATGQAVNAGSGRGSGKYAEQYNNQLAQMQQAQQAANTYQPPPGVQLPGGGVSPSQPGQQTGLPFTQGSGNLPLAGGYPIIGSPFPGPFQAPTTAPEIQSLMQSQQIGNQLSGMGTGLLNLGQQQAAGDFLSPQSNPFFSQNLQASLQPAIDAFTRSTIPQFASQALASGAFKGSSARDMAFGNIANDFGRNLLNTAGQVGMQNYMQERAIQQQTPQLLQQAAAMQQIAPQILGQVGAGERQILQRPLDEALMQFQEAQQAPFRPLNPLASIIQGTNIGGQTTTKVPQISPVAGGIAGALGGGGLGLSLASQLGATGLPAAAYGGAGALLGGALGGLGG